MRSRAFTVLGAVAVIVLSVAVGLMLSSAVTQQPTDGAGGAGETTTPSPTLPPETSALSSALDGITGLISDLLLIGALILGAFLVVRILSRLVRLLRARQLVVENLANSSGSDDIGKSLTGLSQLTREELSRQLRVIRREVDKNTEGGGADSAHVRRSAPLVPMDDDPDAPDVGNALDDTLDTLLESLKGVAPDRIKWVVEFMKLAFPQRGVIVNGDLQRWEDVPSKLGITLSVSDVDNRQNRSYLTVWELLRGSSKAGLKETSKETSEETSNETSGDSPTKEVSKETTTETSDETSTGPAQAAPNVPPASDPPAGSPPSSGPLANDGSTAGDSTKTTHKETSKETLKETSKETSKDVSVSKELTKETSTSQRDLTRGYIGLLKPGCRWLACEISERERLAEVLSIPLVPQAERGGPGERAARERIRTVKRAALKGTISNFYGVLYATSASEFDIYNTGFLQRAADQFCKAINQFADAPERMAELRQLTYEDPEKEGIILLLLRSYLPYENLANTYSLLGRTLIDDPEGRNEIQLPNLECQGRSMALYQKALKRVAEVDPPDLRDIERRIMINRATSQLLTGDPVRVREARAQVTDIAGRPQDLVNETDPRILYSLACWYAVADEVNAGEPDAGYMARRCLAYSLGKDAKRDLWKHASRDRDLASIGREFVEHLELELMRKQLRLPELSSMEGIAFEREMSAVIDAASAASA